MARTMAAVDTDNTGVYTRLSELLALRRQAAGLPRNDYLLQRQLAAGQRRSVQRGRGLNFEELRRYQLGDDIRQFDWKVTHRTQKPHIRVYSEDKEQGVVVLVDQRSNLFFGSHVSTKARLAAELAALLAWQAQLNGNAVGAAVLGDTQCAVLKLARNRAHLSELVCCLNQYNHQLHADCAVSQPLLVMLAKALAANYRGKTLWLISDMSSFDAKAERYLSQLAQANTVHIAMVYDKLERELPAAASLPISNGQQQCVIDSLASTYGAAYRGQFDTRVAVLRRWCREQAISFDLMATDQPAAVQLRAILRANP